LVEKFFSKDDLAVIVECWTEKGWTGTRIAKEFPNKKLNYRKKTISIKSTNRVDIIYIIRFLTHNQSVLQYSGRQKVGKKGSDLRRHGGTCYVMPYK